MPVGRSEAGVVTHVDALLVIGVHREELAFGEAVASLLAERGHLPGLELLRIPDGISGQHPRSDQRFHYELLHRAIYLQIEETAVRHRLLIDLHRGEDDEGPCADVICGDDELLRCVREWEATADDGDFSFRDDRIRTVHLNNDGMAVAKGATAARTVIPPEVWDSPDFLFVGLEIYLPVTGAGRRQDWEFAAKLVKRVVDCSKLLDAGADPGS